MKRIILFLSFIYLLSGISFCNNVIWNIGKPDRTPAGFALAPNGFKKFVENDFGYENKFFLIGFSKEKQDFPYVLPGPVDTWGGTWNTSGWRINQVNILFGIDKIKNAGDYKLVIDLADFAKTFLSLIKVSINEFDKKIQLTADGYDVEKQRAPSYTEQHIDTTALLGNLGNSTHKTIEIPIDSKFIKEGGNEISISVLEGSWIMFDHIRLEGNADVDLKKPKNLFVRNVQVADYSIENDGKYYQPLLINVEHLKGTPAISVKLDGQAIFSEKIEKGNYVFEAPMPAVETPVKSKFQIFEGNKLIEEGLITRSKQKIQTPADYVDTRIGTAHSRWMIAPGPWMPFSMVKFSPDNQNSGWQAGYQPSFESIGTFSHIHEWTMGGLGLFATNGPLITNVGDELKPNSGYRSTIDKKTEKAPIGYYSVVLEDYDIKAELTATTRCSFSRFHFPSDRDSSRILIDLNLPTEYDYKLKEISIKKVSDYRIEGFSHQLSERVWSDDAEQDYTIHFVIEFDQPIKSMGGWTGEKIFYDVNEFTSNNIQSNGAFIEFDTKKHPVVQVRTGISLVSIPNAELNLQTEITIPFGWNFDKIRQNQLDVWNELFDRIKVKSTNRMEKVRFYNSMYRSICSRNIWSDVNGEWKGTDGNVHKLKNENEVALGCDAFWNTFWNLNQFWNLITPEWSSRWVNSQLAMYDAYGWLAKGPAGMNYIPVMVAEHEIPMIVGAYQMGIRDFDAEKALEASVKMQTTTAQKLHTGFVGNRDLKEYLRYEYVPSDKGRFSNTMEYSFDDWTVGQLAKSLGKTEIYNQFNNRGYWWKNAIDSDGYCHMKLSDGKWTENFNPFRSGANEHYVEGNAWQLTFFVPQDVPELINLIGKKRFNDRLEWGFKLSEPWRYNGMNDQYWDYPVVQGNQQSMHFAFLFNWSGKPWSTQKWSRSILERYYGYGVGDAYLGDEDQGQMSAWLIMASLGIFQTDGGCSTNPIYEIASPIFQEVEIDLGYRYGRGEKFTIKANNSSRKNMYVQSAILNGKRLDSFFFPARELLKGGELILEMGAKPNKKWGLLPE